MPERGRWEANDDVHREVEKMWKLAPVAAPHSPIGRLRHQPPALLTMAAVSPAVRAVMSAYDADAPELLTIVHGFHDVTAAWTLTDAAAYGHQPLVESLSARTPALAAAALDAMDFAAESGHFKIVKWLHHHREEGCSTDAMDMAAANGHLEIVQWLHRHRDEGCSGDAIDLAAANGHLPVVKWLHFHTGTECSTDAMDLAAAHGHLEVVKWLHSNRDEGCTKRALVDASAAGNCRVAKWLLQFRTEGCVTAAIHAALRGGHAELVEWLADHAFLRDHFSQSPVAMPSFYVDPEEDELDESDDERTTELVVRFSSVLVVR